MDAIPERRTTRTKRGPRAGARPAGRRFSWLCGLVLCLNCAFAVARGADLTAAFDDANKLYEEGRFVEAAAAYEAMLGKGHATPALYFNLGNASFKAGQVGRSIYYFRLAERLSPRDPDIRANLRFARNAVAGGAAHTPNWWRRGIDRLTLDEWTLLTCGAFWLWLGLLTARQFRRRQRQPSIKGATAIAILTLLLSAGLATAWYSRSEIQSAVVITPEAIVRNGPFDAAPISMNARDGMELIVLDVRGDWLEVSDGTRRIGWLRRDQVALLS